MAAKPPPKLTTAQRRDAKAQALGFTSYGQQYRASKRGYTGDGFQYNAALQSSRGDDVVSFGSRAGVIVSGPARTAAQRRALTKAILRAARVKP